MHMMRKTHDREDPPGSVRYKARTEQNSRSRATGPCAPRNQVVGELDGAGAVTCSEHAPHTSRCPPHMCLTTIKLSLEGPWGARLTLVTSHTRSKNSMKRYAEGKKARANQPYWSTARTPDSSSSMLGFTPGRRNGWILQRTPERPPPQGLSEELGDASRPKFGIVSRAASNHAGEAQASSPPRRPIQCTSHRYLVRTA